jgi:hypothetical protein
VTFRPDHWMSFADPTNNILLSDKSMGDFDRMKSFDLIFHMPRVGRRRRRMVMMMIKVMLILV